MCFMSRSLDLLVHSSRHVGRATAGAAWVIVLTRSVETLADAIALPGASSWWFE
jgi:hypothetical protein